MKFSKGSKIFIASATTAALASSVVVVTPQQTQAAGPFSDVTASDSHYEAIIKLADLGIINGHKDGTYKPESPVTRGQVATILANILNINKDKPKDPGFTDVPKSSDHYAAIAALKEAKIINGYEDNTFKPNEKISRAHLAVMIASALKIQPKDKKALPFTDVTFYNEQIKALYDFGITVGTSKTTFAPNNNVTRGQAASFLYRALEVYDSTFTLSLMHSNDTHSAVDKAPKRATAVKEVRAKNPDALLLDAGDANTGTLYYNEFKGQADIAFMNYMEYDAMTFGNHEFDAGSTPDGHQALVEFIKKADFPFVTSNVDFSADAKFTGLFTDLISSEPENGKIYNGIIKEINGEKVGIFGLTTAETSDISSPGSIAFKNYLEEAEKAVKAFEGLGVDKIIALSHLGFDDNPAIDNDIILAESVDGIDIIVGGHSHTELKEPHVVNTNTKGEAKDTTLIVQAKNASDYLGTLDVTFDDKGVLVAYKGGLLNLANYADDPEALELLKPYKERVDEVGGAEIKATTTAALVSPRITDEGNTEQLSVRKNETALGNLITDGMVEKARSFTGKDVIMAVQNGGGIRSSIDAGPITVAEVIKVLPFMNTLAVMDVTGAELKETFETSVGVYPNENGGFLHVSKGVKVQFDSSKPAGERIVSITYTDANGKEVAIEDNTTYTIATNAFTAKGGDGYDVLAKAYAEGRVTDLGLSDWENLKEHLESIGTITPTTEGRIVDAAK
ncbi:5'-nucleotidase C-terminal domain-containing protein [Lysinibacillus sp. SGAir0095]|uniref:5'-nucleotidase C-terminal domain-containing protein n=1 Tax=Lysinibacillus sp. SGAir0095 TaxID=2070463 RepID=UPI0010CCFE72|nr:5'-nucleotidase C-terminal domain-containing protein [Lysinibacillus sp. SGAir0095]QCR32601.1 bifunctional metallophosphatase/5'-nucleotidase [Lysinibacillus sp. SGAir0095]